MKPAKNQIEAIRHFMLLPYNRKWASLEECKCIKHKQGIWFIKPHLIIERYIDEQGEHFQPIKSFDRYLLNPIDIAGDLIAKPKFVESLN